MTFFLFCGCDQNEFETSSNKESNFSIELAYPNGEAELIRLPNGLELECCNGQYVVEGDIILTEEQVNLLSDGTRSAITGNIVRHWTDGEVFYKFSSSFSKVNSVRTAIQAWENAVVGLRFTEIFNSSGNYIEFVNSDGNSSYIGMIGGRQEIKLYNDHVGVAIHEISHALGLFHEQSRSDRNSWIIQRILHPGKNIIFTHIYLHQVIKGRM